ncbi:MAG: hypothetical protein B7Z37_26630 [Verrucomicrobia bacterium 12-59-8]|nr:MAG: hypothetical protein B7Z37_26630 [Verrucomicrobia bacterium 12-59-8]
MKPLLVIALALAVGYASYEYVYPPFADAMKFTKHLPKKAEPKEVAVIPAPQPIKKAPKIVMDAPAPRPEMKPEEPKTEMAKAPEAPAVDPNAFVPPVFPSVDDVTKNWAVVPKGYFSTPKQVTVKQDLELKMQMGKATAATTFKAGTKIFVMGQEGANLLVGASAGSPMRGLVAMDATDFKEVFTAAYEQVKVVQTENARKAHEYRLAAAERAQNAPASSGGGGSTSNDKPTKAADGTYPLLIASMKAGEVTEIKPDNIKSWSDVAQEKIDGTDYWTVNVKYETSTMFGKFETEAQARVKNGRVEKWVYTGSGEIVP